MADEHDDELPDTSKIVKDIQKAMSAYGEFQAQLTIAINPWQEQWAALQEQLAPLSSAIEPLQKETTTAAIEWCAVQESWREHSAAIQNAAAGWAGAWSKAGAAIARELAEIEPRLQRTLENAAHVGRLGWTVTGNMAPPDMVTLSAMQLHAEADAYMLAWYEELDADLEGLEGRLLGVTELEPFHTSISQVFRAYRRGDYAIAIPCLTAVLERGIRHLGPTERFFSTNMTKTVKDRYDTAKEDHTRTVRASFWMSLYEFVQWFYQHYGPTEFGDDRIFRHGIQHGTQPPPNEKIEVIRLLHALNTITWFYPK